MEVRAMPRVTINDPMLLATARVFNALMKLPPRARQRVFDFVWDKYVVEPNEARLSGTEVR